MRTAAAAPSQAPHTAHHKFNLAPIAALPLPADARAEAALVLALDLGVAAASAGDIAAREGD